MFYCFSLKLCKGLMERGFKYVSTEPNIKFPHLTVFLFEETVELQKAKEELIKKR